MLQHNLAAALGAGLLFLAACGGGSQARSGEEGAPSAPPPRADVCPAQVPGVGAEVDDTDQGAAVTFKTDRKDEVGRLRTSVRNLADQLARNGSAGRPGTAPPGGAMPRTDDTGTSWEARPSLGSDGLPPLAEIGVQDVDKGARLILRAVGESWVDPLRERVRQDVGRMTRGRCEAFLGTGGSSQSPAVDERDREFDGMR